MAAILAGLGAVWAAVRARVTVASVVEALVTAWTVWRARKADVSPIETKGVPVARELGDVCQLAVNVVEDLLEGKSWAEIGLGNGAALQEAIKGIRDIPAEAEASPEAVGATLGLTAGRLARVLLEHRAKAKTGAAAS